MRIRPVTDADFPAVAALTNAYLEHTAIHFGTTAVSADELRAIWHDSCERFAFVVADVDGVLAGFARASPFRERAGYRFTAEVGLYVDAAHHRGGIGRALYEALIETCRAQGYTNLVAAITLPNAPSVRLHERLAFTKVAHFPRIGVKLGAYHDVGFWQLALEQPNHPAEVRTVCAAQKKTPPNGGVS